MVVYSLLYLYECIILLISSIMNNRKTRNRLAIVTIIIMIAVTGTRYQLGGYDYFNYFYSFNLVPTLHSLNIIEYIRTNGWNGSEFGYYMLMSIVKTLGLNFYGFTLIISCFFYYTLYKVFSRYSYNMNLLIIAFFYKGFLDLTFVYMRQSIAVAIFLWAIKYCQERKFYKYFILAFIAFSIHTSAIILFAVYFLCKINISKKTLIILNLILIPTYFLTYLGINIFSYFPIIISIFSNPSAQDKVRQLVQNGGGDKVNILHLVEYSLIMIPTIKYFDKIKGYDENSYFIMKLFVIMLPFFTIFSGLEILSRDKFYFIMTYPLMIEYICKVISKKKTKHIVYVVVMIIAFLGMTKFAIQFDGGSLAHYRSYIIEGLSIFEK